MSDQVHQVYGNRLRVRACGLLVQNDALLMVNHVSLTKSDFWAPPGGGINFNETAEECLRRETKEETGLDTEVVEFVFGCEFIKSPLHAIELFFLLKKTGGSLARGFDPEMSNDQQIIREVRFLTWKEIERLDSGVLHGIFRMVSNPAQVVGLRGYFKV